MSDGCEIYLATSANCGSCGHSCCGNAACSGGQCQFQGIWQNPPGSYYGKFDLSGDYLFVLKGTNVGGNYSYSIVKGVKTAGGGAGGTTLVSGLTSPDWIGTDGVNVYYRADVAHVLYSVPASGGSTQVVESLTTSLPWMDSQNIFWGYWPSSTTPTLPEMKWRDLATAATGNSLPHSDTLWVGKGVSDGTYVYYSETDMSQLTCGGGTSFQVGLKRVPVHGGAVLTYTNGCNVPAPMFTDATYLYLMSGGTLSKTLKGSWAATTVGTVPLDNESVSDGTYAYYASPGSGVGKVRLSDGAVTVLVGPGQQATSVRIDNTCVYYSTGVSGYGIFTINKVP